MSGLLQYVQVLTWIWEDINKDFIVGFSLTRRQNDSTWVVVDCLTKSSYFIIVKSTFSAEAYARIFIYEIVYLHDIPLSIKSYRAAKFTFAFWRSFKKELDKKVRLTTTFHPQMDGQQGLTIQTLENMLRACVIDIKMNTCLWLSCRIIIVTIRLSPWILLRPCMI